MGTIFGSNKDYNRVLATQPRVSINIPKFEPRNNLHEQTPNDSFSIPAPVRISQTEGQKENTTSTFPNEYVESVQPFKQSNPSPAIERTNLFTFINNQESRKFKEEQPQQQIIAQKSSYSVRSNSSTRHDTINGDAVVMSHSVININDQQQKRDNFSSSFRPFSTIVRRNGEQFLVEFKERTERRYVQCIDETTHQKRVFEVTDCIPYRIIRPYKHKSQYLSQNDISQNTFLPSLQSNQQPVRPHILDDQSKTVASSNPIHNRSLNNLVNNASEHDLQQNNINESLTNKTPQNIQYVSPTALFSPQSTSFPRLTTKDATDSIYEHSPYSQHSSFKSLSTDPKIISDQYSSGFFHKQPSLFRGHTPIISDDSASSYISNSSDSEEETDTDDNDTIAQILIADETLSVHEQMNSYFFDNRNSTAVSYEANGIYSSSTPLDLLARSLNPSDRQYYEKRLTIQSYAEPVLNNSRVQQSAYPDYSLISIPIKQPKTFHHDIFL